MSTATSVTPAAVQPGGSSRRGLPSRTQSTTTRTYQPAQAPQRARSTASRPPPSSSRPVEEILPHQDEETSAVNRTSAYRRSSSRDRSTPTRSDSQRSSHHHQRTPSSRQTHDRSPSTMSAHASNQPGPAPVVTPSETRQSKAGKSRTSIPAQTGNWILGKTIGAGSMGKVKLARRAEGGEQVAVKIIPRLSTEEGHSNQSKADRERADHSKEVRTAREAAIVTLLDHPYICGMRDVVRTTYHWYMLFEYVNGGQMLDYIISHGRLKEKQARKFSRQIASALDYCHRNSIVHRDLKIENILISKTGDIKIIDFGLSNLFSPRSHLKTFCGSLYFAAPELLQAKAYTGPEVDVWSFGIVLYVLVCGKVPFDDQSMPALHAKIKKGLVDYPAWLSAECKNLISRMLVTDPKQRASLQEIMNHPWMIKGFGSAPENYLPAREPIQMPLDPEVIHAMTGFDFGAPEVIHAQLSKVIESEDYQRAVRNFQAERGMQAPNNGEKKRGFGFDFYKRRSSTTSRDTLTMPSSEGLNVGADPTNAFSPLISVYYLVREKQERDRQLANPGATSMPRTPTEAPLQQQVPDIAPPKAAHTNAAAYEMPGEKPTGGRSRPRARTHGEDEVTDAMKHVRIAGSSSGLPPAPEPPIEYAAKKESTAAGLLRRFSTRKRREPERERIDRSHPPPVVRVNAPGDVPATIKKSFSVRRPRDKDRSGSSATDLRPAVPPKDGGNDMLSPARATDAPRSSTKLGRSASVNSTMSRRLADRHMANEPVPRVTYTDAPGASGSEEGTNSRRENDIEQKTNLNPRSTGGATRAKSLGHARRESIQARRARREEAREANVPEETDGELAETSGVSAERVEENAEIVKPVYLKGLFSVSTTSTKPVPVIRADIVRVLKQLGVEYTEIRGGFSCRHIPSIDLNRVVDAPPSPQAGSGFGQNPGHRRKISFGGLMGGNDRDEFRDSEKTPQTPKTPRRSTADRADRSYTNSDASDESIGNDHNRRPAAGETTTHVQSDIGGSMILNFEIYIVKVPLLAIHGIQFKRLAGGTWQYKGMAEAILRELKL